jgi:arylsulfatase A-like enzyme
VKQTAVARRTKNVLFIMCDQLRWDYLSCYGHPRLHTPHIDGLAARGVRFTRAYVQSPVCGAARMSFTGRYVQSHGASWNGFPLKVGELTMGDYLRPLGVDTVLAGKTHMQADTEGMERLGIDPDSIIGVRLAECGFDPYERDDGLHAIGPDGRYDPRLPRYNRYLNERGYAGDNPWHDWGQRGGRHRQRARLRLDHAACAQAGASERGGFRDPLHDPARHRLHTRRQQPAVVPASVLHQAALALHRAGPSNDMYSAADVIARPDVD